MHVRYMFHYDRYRRVFVAKQAVLNTVISHESVLETIVSKSEQLIPSFQENISGAELMNKYRLLHDRTKVTLSI